jgi:hypothetical protein
MVEFIVSRGINGGIYSKGNFVKWNFLGAHSLPGRLEVTPY